MTKKELVDYLAGFKDEDEVKITQGNVFNIAVIPKEPVAMSGLAAPSESGTA